MKKLLELSPSTDVLGKGRVVDVHENSVKKSMASSDGEQWFEVESDVSDLLLLLRSKDDLTAYTGANPSDNTSAAATSPSHTEEKETVTGTLEVTSEEPNSENSGHNNIGEKEPGFNSSASVEAVKDNKTGISTEKLFTKDEYSKLHGHLNNRYSLNICDTGGQLELQELLPLFIAGSLIFIFVFPLQRSGLKFCPKVSFRCEVDGKIENMNCYEASRSIEDLLRQTLSSVKALTLTKSCGTFKTKKECIPRIFLVGTHKDILFKEFIVREYLKKHMADKFDGNNLKIEYGKKDTFSDFDPTKVIEVNSGEFAKEWKEYRDKYMTDMDKQLEKIASGFNVYSAKMHDESTVFFQVDNTERCRDLVDPEYFVAKCKEETCCFQVNETDSKKEEKDVFWKFRSGVNGWIKSHVNEFKIEEYPINYLVASLLLSKKSEHFVEKEEFATELLSNRINIQNSEKESSMKDFLSFLHKVTGQIRFYPTVAGMENVIINKPQDLFKLITYLIISKEGLDKEDLKEFNKGIFTRGHFNAVVDKQLEVLGKKLRQEEKNLFSSDNFLGILRELCIVTQLNDKDKDEEVTEDSKLFMPCKLNQAEEVKSQRISPYCSPLAIQFKSKHCPKSLFGFLVHFVMQDLSEDESVVQGRWTLKEEAIFRDHVSFAINNRKDTVTLIFCSSHILVEFFPSSATLDDGINVIRRHCIETRKKLNSAVKRTIKHLQYNSDKIEHQFVYIYRCCREKYLYPREDEFTKGKSYFHVCCNNVEYGKKTEIWFGGK